MGFSGNHLTSDHGENLPQSGTPGDLLSAFADHGDEAAFAEIVRRYAGMVFATCLKSTKDAHDAEDATQAVFLSLAVQCKTGKEVRALGPWLKQVAKRAGLDVRKSRRRRERREQAHAQNTAIELGCPDGVLGTPAPRLTEYAQAASDPEELQRLVSQELNGLPATYRLPLISQYFGGLSQKQIASQLGIKPGAVAVRIHRGRVMLAKRLQSLGAELPPGWSNGEEEASVYACIGSAVSATMVARIAESMAQMGLGYSATGSASASLLSIARTAAAGAAAAAKLKIAIAIVLCLGLAASATGWAKNVNLDIDFNGFPSLQPIINFLRNLGGARMPVRIVQAPATTPATVVATSSATDEAHLPDAIVQGPTAPAFVHSSPAVAPASGFAGNSSNLLSAPVSVAVSSNPLTLPPSQRLELPTARVAPPSKFEPVKTAAASGSAASLASIGANRQHLSATPGGGSRTMSGDVEISPTASLLTALSGNANSIFSSGGQLSIGAKAGGRGDMAMRNDHFAADAQAIGPNGLGHLSQEGGLNSFMQMSIGEGPTGSGKYDLKGTAVVRPSFASASGAVGVRVGGSGKGELNVGDPTKPGLLFEASNLKTSNETPAAATMKPRDSILAALGAEPAHLIVRADPSGSGTITGWGGANGNGAFINNDRVIAEGYGHERSLIFTGYTSVTNTIENDEGRGAGWYAQGGGRLRLPKVHTEAGTHSFTWGEDGKDATIDLVNSVRVTLHDMPAADSLEINLLDKTRSDVPALPAGHTFVGVWSFDTLAARPGAVDLTVRYDDALAEQLKLNESALKLWEFENGVWTRLDHDPSFSRDLENHILSAQADGHLSFFAVSAPEPGSASMLLVIGGGIMLRRRRQPRV